MVFSFIFKKKAGFAVAMMPRPYCPPGNRNGKYKQTALFTICSCRFMAIKGGIN